MSNFQPLEVVNQIMNVLLFNLKLYHCKLLPRIRIVINRLNAEDVPLYEVYIVHHEHLSSP